jgi:hypothetical protein
VQRRTRPGSISPWFVWRNEPSMAPGDDGWGRHGEHPMPFASARFCLDYMPQANLRRGCREDLASLAAKPLVPIRPNETLETAIGDNRRHEKIVLRD